MGISIFLELYFLGHESPSTSPMRCRLRLELTELLKRSNGLFDSVTQTGSIGMVTIDCTRLGFMHKGAWKGLLAQPDLLLSLAKQSLEIKSVEI